MSKWSLPKIEKVYEALSAVLDDRVELKTAKSAAVTSSSRDKAYLVEWSDDGKQIISNDNATYYQGYMGYPIISVVIKRGLIQFDIDAVRHLGNIHWKAVNKKYKNNYEKAVEHVLSELTAAGVDVERVREEVARIYVELDALNLEPLRLRRAPPKGA